jgi:hemerythrin superfamily protein
MNALQLLKEDHAKVAVLLNKIERTSERAKKSRKTLFSQLKESLKMHETIEEKIFYPACKNYDETLTLTFEALEEHSVVDKVIEDLMHSRFDSKQWTGRFTVLKESVTHHVKEEEKKLFPRIKKLMTASQLEEIGKRMQILKTKYSNQTTSAKSN